MGSKNRLKCLIKINLEYYSCYNAFKDSESVVAFAVTCLLVIR